MDNFNEMDKETVNHCKMILVIINGAIQYLQMKYYYDINKKITNKQLNCGIIKNR
jgi:hypothetical protein